MVVSVLTTAPLAVGNLALAGRMVFLRAFGCGDNLCGRRVLGKHRSLRSVVGTSRALKLLRLPVSRIARNGGLVANGFTVAQYLFGI